VVRRIDDQSTEQGTLEAESVARLAALTEIVRVVGSSHDYGSLLFNAARAARIALGGDSVSVSRWERESGQVRTLVNEGHLMGWEAQHPVDEVYPIREDPSLTALLLDGRGYYVTLDGSTSGPDRAILLDTEKACGLDVPIVVEGQVWGDLWIARTGDTEPFTDSELDFATLVVAQVATAISAGERLERVSQLAYLDPLTGLANRRAVDERLDAAVDAHLTQGWPVSLLVCDVNGLKEINDSSGHEAGDRALIELALLISAAAALAPGSLAARLGGDEFCIVLDGHSGDVAAGVAEQLSERAAAVLPHGISCGVASTDDDIGEVRSTGRILRLADSAQYRAKRARSLRPVIAGRSLAAPISSSAQPNSVNLMPERRQVRGRTRGGIDTLLELGLANLDQDRPAPVGSRVDTVADVITQYVDASGWWVSTQPGGGDLVRTTNFAAHRRSEPHPGSMSVINDQIGAEFNLDDYPLSRAALAGGSYVVTIDDPYADASEVAMLQGVGCIELLIVGGVDRNGDGWLIEIFGDEISQPLLPLTGLARALLSVALNETMTLA
jgi:diguanylate cyclase (GGDEF)-like protein